MSPPIEMERLSVAAWLARLDEIQDHGHGLYWRTLERLARYADYTSGDGARPSLATLTGGKAWPSAVREHLRLAERAGLLMRTVRPGRPASYSLCWPAGESPAEVLARLRSAGLTPPPQRRPTPPGERRGGQGNTAPPPQRRGPSNYLPVQDDPAAPAATAAPAAGWDHPAAPAAPHPAAPQVGPRRPSGADLLRPSGNQEQQQQQQRPETWGPDEPYPVGPEAGPLDAPPDTRPFPARDPEADLRVAIGREPTEDELAALAVALRVAREQHAGIPRTRALVRILGRAMARGTVPDGGGWAASVLRRISPEEELEHVQALERRLRAPAPKPAVPTTPRWIGCTPSRIDCRDRIETLRGAIARTHELGEEVDPRTLEELAEVERLLAQYEARSA